MTVNRKPIIAWAIMDGDNLLAKLFTSDHRWHIYDSREVARTNLRVYGKEYGFRVAQVQIIEVTRRGK